MIITCENCSTRFILDDSLIKPEGSKVRCSKCSHIFSVLPKEGNKDLTLEPDSPEDVVFDEPDENYWQAPPQDPDGKGGSDADDSEIDFDTAGFDDDLEFDHADLSFDAPDRSDGEAEIPEEDAFDIPDDDLTFDVPDLSIDGLEDELPPPGQDEPPPLEMEMSEPSPVPSSEPDLEMEADDEAQEFEDLDFDDLEDITLEDDEPALETEDGADIDFSFDDDALSLETPPDPVAGTDSLELEEIPLEMAADDSEEVDFDTGEIIFEEIPFEDEASDTQPEDALSLEIDSDPGHQLEDEDTSRDHFPEADLELSFDDDLGTEDIEFDDLDSSEEFPSIPDAPDAGKGLEFEQQTSEAAEALTLDVSEAEESDEAFDEAFGDPSQEDRKFAEYDQVLEQDTEPKDTFPDRDEELTESPEPVQEQIPPAQAPSDPDPPQPPSPLIAAPADGEALRRKRRKRRGGVSTPFKIILLILLLAISAYLISLRLGITIPFLSQIEIPFITQAFKPAPPSVAAIGPIPNDPSTKGRFVTNDTAGRLFIVTGKLDNPDKTAYSHVRVKGTLITKDGKKAVTQVVYCGNVISEETLKTGNISDINKQLDVKAGIENTNINIKPGASVRFMLVFSNLPDNLANFTVEVQDYDSAGPQ